MTGHCYQLLDAPHKNTQNEESTKGSPYNQITVRIDESVQTKKDQPDKEVTQPTKQS